MSVPSENEVTRGSGNVFADLGLPDADDHRLKADFVLQIRDIIAEQGLTQTAAASQMGLKQPNLSKMLSGHFRGVSIARLMRMLTALGQDVTIQASPAKAKDGEPRVWLRPRDRVIRDIAAA